MRGKVKNPQVFEGIKEVLEPEKCQIDMGELTIKISLRDMTQEERIREASKPLYLKRYE